MLSKLNIDRLWSFHNRVVKAELQLSYAHAYNETQVDKWEQEVDAARRQLSNFIKANTLPEMKVTTRDKKPKYHRPTFKESNRAAF